MSKPLSVRNWRNGKNLVERYIKGSDPSIVKWIFLILFAALFVFNLWFVFTGQSQVYDELVQRIFLDLRDEALTAVFRAITFCGNETTMIGLCIFIVILPGRMKVGLPVALMTVVGWFAHTLLKGLIARPRPDMEYWLVTETSFSFPSGHANVSMIFFIALAILVGRALILQDNWIAAILLRVIFTVLAVLIGLSRLYLGVHFASDVFGGWLLAGMILIVLFAVYDNLWPYKWRMTYNLPEWNSIPRNDEKRRVWRRPSKKRAPAELLTFPKKTSPWKIKRPADLPPLEENVWAPENAEEAENFEEVESTEGVREVETTEEAENFEEAEGAGNVENAGDGMLIEETDGAEHSGTPEIAEDTGNIEEAEDTEDAKVAESAGGEAAEDTEPDGSGQSASDLVSAGEIDKPEKTEEIKEAKQSGIDADGQGAIKKPVGLDELVNAENTIPAGADKPAKTPKFLEFLKKNRRK